MPSTQELREAREKAGAVVISLRDESLAEGFTESAQWEEKWANANNAYNAALEAEETAAQAETRRTERARLADRIREDASRISHAERARMRPDFDPRTDPRSRGGSGFPTAGDWATGLRVWAGARRPDFDPTDEQLAAVRRCRMNIHSDEIIIPTGAAVERMVGEMQEVFAEYHPSARRSAIRKIVASWNTMTPDSAAYIAEPPQLLRQLEVNKLSWGGLLQVATVKTTTTGEDILLPFTDDTTIKGRRIAEDGPLGTERNPRIGLMKWGNHKYTSDIIAVTYEMLRDSFIDLEGHIGTVGGERLGRIENDEFTIGNGASMPRGIVFAAPVGVTTASATAITSDEVIDLEASVDEAYQAGDRVGFMMHKNVLVYLRKLKDTTGRPLYVLGQETGRRDQLNGKPIYINMSMDSTVAATKDVMLYGDLSKYWIRRVGGSRVVRDPYTQRISNDRDLFAVVEYADGNLVNAGTAPVKKMRMHA